MLQKKNFPIMVMNCRKVIKGALLLLGFAVIYYLIEVGLGWFGVFLYQHNLDEVAFGYWVLYGMASLCAIVIVPNVLEIVIFCIVDKWEKQKK